MKKTGIQEKEEMELYSEELTNEIIVQRPLKFIVSLGRGCWSPHMRLV